jgi:hypothetical protein
MQPTGNLTDLRCKQPSVIMIAPAQARPTAVSTKVSPAPSGIFWGLLVFLLSILSPVVGIADEATCGSLRNAYGPFDYRDPEAQSQKLEIVDINHFTRDVENLVRGITGTIPGDLDYTLRAFPNHHRALYSAARYAASGMKPPLVRSIDCYFDRARRMAPTDPQVLVIQGVYLSKMKRRGEGIEAYRAALTIDPGLVEAHYNLGLELLETGQLAEANRHAQVAYRGGYPFPGLRGRLQRLGAWKPEAVPDAATIQNPASP